MATDLPTSASLTGVGTTRAQQKLNWAALRDFMANLLGTDSSDKGAARTTLGVSDVPGMRNLLDNANFAINQRVYVSGAATVAANQVTLDRWRVVTSGQNITFATYGNGKIVTAPAGGIEQVIFGDRIGVVTHVINWVGTATCTVDGVAKSKGDSVTLVPGTNCSVKFFGGTVAQPQLEAGPVASTFEHRDSSIDKTICKTCYRTSYISVAAGSVSSAGVVYGGHYYNSSASANGVGVIKIDFDTDMRATPTVFIYSPATGAVNNVDDGADRAAAVVGNSLRGICVNYTGNGGQIGKVHYTASTGY